MQPEEPHIASVWARPRRESPAKEQLSRARIVAEAVRLLDTEGMEALSMRSLGTRLGAGATSLYRHVASKDELIELVVDEVYAEVDVPDVTHPETWRLAATAGAHSLRQMGLRHMWAMAVLGQVGMTYLGPNVMDVSSRALKVYTAAGFDPGEASQALATVSAYVIGITTAETGWLSALARNGLDEDRWLEIMAPSMRKAADSGYQELADVYMPAPGADLRQARRDNFVYGLERVLDGLEVRLAAVRSARPVPAPDPAER